MSPIIFSFVFENIANLFFSEREKSSQREELWNQLEVLARQNNPDWQNVIDQMHQDDMASYGDSDYMEDNTLFLSDKMDQAISREVLKNTIIHN